MSREVQMRMDVQKIVNLMQLGKDILEAIETTCCVIMPLLIFRINFAELAGKPQKQETSHKNLTYSYLSLVFTVWLFVIFPLTKIELIISTRIWWYCYSVALLFLHSKWHKKKSRSENEGLYEKILKLVFKKQEGDKNTDGRLLQKAQEILDFFSFDAYEKCADGKGMFLKEEYVQHRCLYRLLSFMGIFLLFLVDCLVENAEWTMGDKFIVVSAACFLALYFVELYSYYNGCTKKEYMEKEAQAGTGLAKLTSDKYDTLYSKSVSIQDIDDKKVMVEKLETLNRASEGRLRCLGKALSNDFNEEDYHLDFISAAIRLMNYESIYFATPFYKDIGKYIFPFLSLELLENKKILVISGTKDSENELRQWFVEGLESRYGHLDFWEIEKIQDSTREADIGIVSLEQINEVVIGNESAGFWENISTVLLLEPSCFLLYHPLFISQILSKFRMYQEKVTYVVCDVNINGMVDLLSDMLKVSFVYVNATMNSKEGTHSIVNVDQSVTKGAFTVVRQCFANELQVAADIRKGTQDGIHWYGNGILPVWDVSWEAGQYYQLFAEQTHDRPNMSLLYEIFDFQEDGSKASQEKRVINFVEDSLFNAFELFRQFDTRGKKYFHTVLFSPNYMLLEYMIENDQKMLSDAQYIAQQMPKFQFSLKNLCIALGYRLTKGSVSSKELEEIVKYYSFENVDIQEMLKEINTCYMMDFEIDEMQITENGMREGEYRHYSKEYIVLSQKGKDSFLNWYHENIETALYYNELIDKEAHYLNALAGGHVYQFYLPNQYFVLEGKYYKIKAIEKQSGKRILKLQRAANSCKNRRYYRQIRQYRIFNLASTQQLMRRGYICLQKGVADIEVSTRGYIDSNQFNDLNSNNIVETRDIPIRKYKRKIYLKVTIEEGNAYTYAILLKEILFSIFPHCWQLLSITMQTMKPLEGRVDNLLILTGDSMEENIESIANQFDNSFYIIEDSPMDLGLLETIYNEFGNLLDIILEYAAWRRNSQNLAKFWGADFLQNKEVFDLESVK